MEVGKMAGKQNKKNEVKLDTPVPAATDITLPVEPVTGVTPYEGELKPAYFDKIEQGGYVTPNQESLYRDRQLMDIDRKMFTEALDVKYDVFATKLAGWKTNQLAQFEAMQGLQAKQLVAMTTMQEQSIDYQLAKATADQGSQTMQDENTRLMDRRFNLGQGVRERYAADSIINLG
tara:strand:- start:3866 stop:4393 length:528 start_codon:yes stop_codon:yes gene_type:complete